MDKFRLLVCGDYAEEFAWAARKGNIEDMEIIAFPCLCQDKTAGPVAQELLKDATDGAVICSRHCEILSLMSTGHNLLIWSSDSCATSLIGDGLPGYISRSGGYLLTLGWLRNWRQRLAAQGFDQQTARMFYKDCCKELVFLDAGVEPQAGAMLQEISEYLGLPHVAIPVQQDTLLVLLRSLQCNWRLQRAGKEEQSKLKTLQASAAESAAIVDIMGRLAIATSKREAIERIKHIFISVLGAGEFRFWDSEYSSADIPAETRLFFGEEVRNYILDEGASSFIVKIRSHDRVFGAVEAGQFLFPEQIDRYLSFAVAIAPVCGLVLANIDNYERLLQSEQELQHLSFHDDLTGLKNRNFLATLLDKGGNAKGSTVFMFDLDGLKRVNDQFGHLEGDLLIVGAAQILRDCFRETDVVARVGGDEFLVIAYDCERECAEMLARRLDDKIAEHNLSNDRQYLNIALSRGYTQPETADEALTSVIRRADELMYRNKRSKRSD